MPEPAFNALQISLRELHFDEPTTVTMHGYVIGIAQRNVDGEGQLYVSRGSFKVRRDLNAKTKDDVVRRWEGDGETVFSTPLQGLDNVSLDLYFVRDNRRLREFGAVLEDAFGGHNAAVNQVVKLVTAALPATGAPGALVALAPAALKGLGNLLRRIPNRVKVRAEGGLRLSTLQQMYADDPDFPGELSWGRDKSDKGYFRTDWDLVNMNNPQAIVVQPKIPPELSNEIGMM